MYITLHEASPSSNKSPSYRDVIQHPTTFFVNDKMVEDDTFPLFCVYSPISPVLPPAWLQSPIC